MRLQPDSPRRADEPRSYFPDWTPHLPRAAEELEAAHNSYLAGGYAEEFGYIAQLGASRGVPVIDGESPEQSVEWRFEARAMHPGYPIKPYPLASDLEIAAFQERRHASLRPRSPKLDANEAPRVGFVPVIERPYERERRRSGQRAAAALTRLLARVVAFRWELPRRRVRAAEQLAQRGREPIDL
ncbi:MAG TPA: hypothetical protein VG994_05765 [Steroidobacteraceae bacterium]|nr:hypothetical protein [Steroidobacteraceae bacterium]